MTSIAVESKVAILHVPMAPPPVRGLRPTLSLDEYGLPENRDVSLALAPGPGQVVSIVFRLAV